MMRYVWITSTGSLVVESEDEKAARGLAVLLGILSPYDTEPPVLVLPATGSLGTKGYAVEHASRVLTFKESRY